MTCVDAFAGVLHTIIFNRALGPVRPREIDSELFDITYVRFSHLELRSGHVYICAVQSRSLQSHSNHDVMLVLSPQLCWGSQVQCGDPLVERVIEEKIDQFYGWVEKHPGKRGQVSGKQSPEPLDRLSSESVVH